MIDNDFINKFNDMLEAALEKEESHLIINSLSNINPKIFINTFYTMEFLPELNRCIEATTVPFCANVYAKLHKGLEMECQIIQNLN